MSRRQLAVAAVVLAGGALMVLVSPSLVLTEREGLHRLPPEDRRALYEVSSRNATALCRAAASEHALDDRCIDAASFLRAFPECDRACQTFADQHERGPTR